MTTTGHIPVSSLKFVNQEKSLTQLMLSNLCLLGVRKPIELTKVGKNQSAQLSDCLRWQQLTEVKNYLIWMQPGNRRNFKFYTDIYRYMYGRYMYGRYMYGGRKKSVLPIDRQIIVSLLPLTRLCINILGAALPLSQSCPPTGNIQV